MSERFSTNGYYIYDTFHDGRKWLLNNVEAWEVVKVMNDLDEKARERSKALSKLQCRTDGLLDELYRENKKLKLDNEYLTILLASIRGLFEEKSIVTKTEFEEVIFNEVSS